MTHWHWYVAQDDELLIDLDSRVLLEIALKRMRDSSRLEVAPLQIDRIFVASSTKPDHFHLAIKMLYPMSVLYRMTWQLFLYDDVNRAVHNLFRALDGNPSPCLIISPSNWLTCSAVALKPEIQVGEFWRSHDAVCTCPVGTHKNRAAIREHCPAHRLLRNEGRFHKHGCVAQ